MSIEAMAVVLHHSKAHGTTKIIALGIANHQGDGGAYPSRATLAKYGNCSDRQVTRAIQELIELGEIVVDPRAGVNGTNVYKVVIRCPEQCDGSTNHRKKPTEALDTSVYPPRHPRPDPLDTHVYTPWTSMSSKPSYNHKLTNTEKTEIEKAREDREQRLRRHEELKKEMHEAAQRAVPMPICEHGKKLLKCQQCITALAKEERKEA